MAGLIVVTGAAGFIGRALCRFLRERGERVRAVDIKINHNVDSQIGDDNVGVDLTSQTGAEVAISGGEVDTVYHLAAWMGGIGLTSRRAFDVAATNARIDLNVIGAAVRAKVGRFIYASSACVYPIEHPLPGYGDAKLFGERLCAAAAADHGLSTFVARIFTVYGPGDRIGPDAKFIPALCEKAARAEMMDTDVIEVWGSGEQKRSVIYIDDCVDALWRLAHRDSETPLIVDVASTTVVTPFGVVEELGRILGRTFHAAPYADGPGGHPGQVANQWTSLGGSSPTPFPIGLERTYRDVANRVG